MFLTTVIKWSLFSLIESLASISLFISRSKIKICLFHGRKESIMFSKYNFIRAIIIKAPCNSCQQKMIEIRFDWKVKLSVSGYHYHRWACSTRRKTVEHVDMNLLFQNCWASYLHVCEEQRHVGYDYYSVGQTSWIVQAWWIFRN